MTQYSPPPYQQQLPTSGMATASLIMGILGWTLLPLLGSLIAIVTGHMAKSEIRNSMGQIGGDGLATAGLVLGYLSLGMFVCGCLIWLGVMALGFIPLLAAG
jgi:hypothetical protein